MATAQPFPRLPSYTWYVARHPGVDDVVVIPGVVVFGITPKGGGKHSWQRIKGRPSATLFQHQAIKAPAHAASFVQAVLRAGGVPYKEYGVRDDPGAIPPWTDGSEEAGRLWASRMEGVVLPPGSAGGLKPQQAWMIVAGRNRPALGVVSTPGTGKTVAILRIIDVWTTGKVLVITPAATRYVWGKDAKKFTRLDPYRVAPPSMVPERPAWDAVEPLVGVVGNGLVLHYLVQSPDGIKTLCGREPTTMVDGEATCGGCRRAFEVAEEARAYERLDEYMARKEADGGRSMIIVGHEALPDNLNWIEEWGPNVVVLDEPHLMANPSQTSRVAEQDGTLSYKPKRSRKTGRVTRSWSVAHITRLDSVQKRMCLDGTPFHDGSPGKAWAILDYLWPGTWGTYHSFTARYEGGRMGDHWVCDGPTHEAELAERLRWMLAVVPYARVKDGLPPIWMDVRWLPKEAQTDPGMYSGGAPWSEALRGQRSGAREVRRQYACALKRGTIIDEAASALAHKLKVIVFVGRVAEVGVLREAILATVKASTGRDIEQEWMAYSEMQGGPEESIRSYAEAIGQSLLIATWQCAGTGIDGLQTTDLAIIAQLPDGPGALIQIRGRVERYGGHGCRVLIPLAEGTEDEKDARRIVAKRQQIADVHDMAEIAEIDDDLRNRTDPEALADAVADALSVDLAEAEAWVELLGDEADW